MKNILFCCFWLTCVQANGFTGRLIGTFTKSPMRDLYSTRANTLSDDADDLQKQLDNEARDRLKFGRPKEVWELHFPPHISGFKGIDNLRLPWSSILNQKCAYEQNCLCDSTENTLKMPFPSDNTKNVSITSNNSKKVPYSSNNSNKVPSAINSSKKVPCTTYSKVEVPFTSNETNKVTYSDPYEKQDYIAVSLDYDITDWDYKNQKDWKKLFPGCGGRYQSPVDLPYSGMVKIKGYSQMFFRNYDIQPKSMSIVNDGKTVSIFGEWPASQRPLIHGGAAYSRRYLFHSLAVRWPSEHTVGGLSYPMETQAIHISAEYASLDDAMTAALKDKLAVLAVANIYMYSNRNHMGLEELVKGFMSTTFGSTSITARPLKVFNPPLKEYAAYHGSLTTPPCTEAVLWLVRARPLPIRRALAEALAGHLITSVPGQIYFRSPQPVNDRKIYFFDYYRCLPTSLQRNTTKKTWSTTQSTTNIRNKENNNNTMNF